MQRKRTILVILAIVFLIVVSLFIVIERHSSKQRVQQALINSQDKNLPSDPALSKLPYYNPHFELRAQLNGSQKPRIVFVYLPDVEDQQAGPAIKQTYISDAKTWLAQQNLSDYTLIDNDTGLQLN